MRRRIVFALVLACVALTLGCSDDDDPTNPAPDVVTYYDNYDLWRDAVLSLPGGQVYSQTFTAAELADAEEVASPPTEDNYYDLPSVLTFSGASTGLPLDFALEAPHGPYFLSWNDTEFPPDLFPMLSVGDADNSEDDDFQITVTNVAASREVLAVGIRVGHSDAEDGESLQVYGASDHLLAAFTEGLPDSSGHVFMGVVSTAPIDRIFYDEDEGGDDICITEPCFGLTGDAARR